MMSVVRAASYKILALNIGYYLLLSLCIIFIRGNLSETILLVKVTKDTISDFGLKHLNGIFIISRISYCFRPCLAISMLIKVAINTQMFF